MLFDNVVIKSVVHIEPPHRVSSDEVAERLAPTFKRLRVPGNPLIDLAGIHERRFWDDGMMPSDGATLAAHKALAQADIDPKQIGILINTSVSPRFFLSPRPPAWFTATSSWPTPARALMSAMPAWLSSTA